MILPKSFVIDNNYLLIVMKRVIDRLIPVTCISRQLKLSSYRVIFMIKYWRMFNS